MKSPEAFRTISEVAEELDLPQHVLRFWETKFPQIKPLKRGGGRRYYRPDDVLLLRGIRQLLYGEGYTIRGVQRILKEQGVRYAVGLGSDIAGARPVPAPAEDEEAEERRVEPRFEEAEAVEEADERGGFGEEESPPEEEPAHRVRLAPAPAMAPAPRLGGRVLSADGERRLRSALNDLLECKRLLERQP